MIQRPAAELSVELLGSEPAEVVNGEGPQVENVVPGERLSLFYHHHLSPEQGQFDGCSQAARPGAQHETLGEKRESQQGRPGVPAEFTFQDFQNQVLTC